jgi:hypothetical protein
MTNFILGLFVGVFLGFLSAALAQAAARGDLGPKLGGHQPRPGAVPRPRARGGYQPTHGPADPKPPRGGSGAVPAKRKKGKSNGGR